MDESASNLGWHLAEDKNLLPNDRRKERNDENKCKQFLCQIDDKNMA